MRPGFEDWDRALEQVPEATFYHTRIWAGIVLDSFEHLTDESEWIETDSGRAALPRFAWHRFGGWITTIQSSFPFLYGGPVPRTLGGRDLLPTALDRMKSSRRSTLLIGNPFASGPDIVSAEYSVRTDVTHLLVLPRSYEEYWDGVLTTAKRNDVRRCAKKGVEIRLGGTENEVATFYGFYRNSFSRWGGRPRFVHPERFYQAMIRLGRDHVRLYLAEREGRILGGALVPRWNGHVHYHAGYFDHSARALRPTVLIQERIVRDAIEDGFKDYDLLPSGGNRGVEEFKEGFGAVRTPFSRYEHRSPIHRIVGSLRRLAG